MSRVEWDPFFLGMAKYVSQRGTCPTRQVGAVIVDAETNSVLSVGYNGSPRGTSHCGEDCAQRKMGENPKVCKAVHAELNAIFNAAFNGVKVRDSKLYVTVSPCLSCARAIIQSGVSEVVASGKSPYDRAIELLKEGGVKLRIISGLSLPRLKFVMDKIPIPPG